MTKTYDIFLFDADRTLFDFDRAEAEALERMLGRYGFEYSENVLRKYREISSELWMAFEKGTLGKTELLLSRFIQLFDYLGVSQEPEVFNETYVRELGKGAFLMEGAYEICENIVTHGKLIYIVTNGVLVTQRARIENSLIKEYISDYFVSEEVGFNKPHPSYFKYVFSHIPQIEKEKILLVGDSLTADIDGGNRAGIDSCWFHPPGITNDTNIIPTCEITALAELSKFLDQNESDFRNDSEQH